MMRTSRMLATVLAVFSASVHAAAQSASAPEGTKTKEGVEDLDLVKLLNVQVSTATKTAENIDDAPAVITVVTRADIARWGYQTVAEVLQHTVGFYLTDDHILPNVGVRGMTGGLGAESGMIKVMIDGRSVAYRTTSGNWLGVELIPLTSVAQIEIIRGPVSALYGADAFLGVVNIITQNPEDVRPFTGRVALGLTETNPGGRFDVSGGARFGHFDFLLGAAGESTDRTGLALPAESPAPRLPDDIGTRRTTLNLKRESLVLQSRFGYRVPEGEVVVSGYASGLRRGGDFASWAQLTNGVDSAGRERGTVVSLGQYRLNLDATAHASSSLDLALSTTYFQGGVLPADRVEVASDLFYVEREATYSGVDGTVEARLRPWSGASVIAGVQTVYDHEELDNPVRIDRATDTPVPQTRPDPAPLGLFDVGTYVNASYKVFDPWLKLNGGVRYDHHSEYGGQLTGRVGATSRWSRALVSKLLYGTAFKAPSPYLLHAVPLRLGDVSGNPALKPQLIRTLEYQLSFKPDRFFGVTSAVAYNWLLQKAEFTPEGSNQTARNVASQHSLAWETRADLAHYNDYTLYGAVDLVFSERELGQQGYVANLVGTRNVAYPPWIGRTGVTFAVPSPPRVPLQLGAEGMVVGPRRAADTSIVERGEPFTLPSYFMLDLSLSTRDLYLAPGHTSRVALRSRNLLVARGPDPGFAGFEYPLAPAEIFLEIEHSY
jgi:outer membrane receptor for ferrienterochelin and colicins